ncbi:MAG: HNH endonuclease [Candidatus Omnitrophica bacterium]|nr:HNH endonuclease [Candidatus Omnitrophota bacterium]
MIRKKVHRYTDEQLQFLRDKYVSMSRSSLSKAFNARFGTAKTERQITSTLKNHGIQSGRGGFFVKGHTPWNRGKKGCTAPNSGQFKPGHTPRNKRRLWSERVNRDGYVEISVPERNPHTGAPTRFRPKHVWLWEMEHGPVPKAHALVFKDGNPLNCVIENLLMVTRSELLCLNLHGYNGTRSELKPSVLALAKLDAKAGIRTQPGRGRRKKKEASA